MPRTITATAPPLRSISAMSAPVTATAIWATITAGIAGSIAMTMSPIVATIAASIMTGITAKPEPGHAQSPRAFRFRALPVQHEKRQTDTIRTGGAGCFHDLLRGSGRTCRRARVERSGLVYQRLRIIGIQAARGVRLHSV